MQVEHGVTEEVSGIDLVEWMIRVAAGEPPDLGAYRYEPRGHAIQVRLYAEDPSRNFRPSSGPLSHVALPGGVRVDGWIETGTEVSSFYDPLLAKIIAHAPTRELALRKLRGALDATSVYGIETNLEYLRAVLDTGVFREGRQFTRFLAEWRFSHSRLKCFGRAPRRPYRMLPGGSDSGMWGFRPRVRWTVWHSDSPTASLATHAAPRGWSSRKRARSAIRCRQCDCADWRDDDDHTRWPCCSVLGADCRQGGSVLSLGNIDGAGQRAYLAVKGGFDVPEYLGSRSTFTLGQFGGHVGRALRKGDVLRLTRSTASLDGCVRLSSAEIPTYGKHWDIAVTYGPHGAPDFFTAEDIDTFFTTDWEVHYNSSRTGVRLIGPKPQWARTDGGEAGLHPSNIHDNAYAIGAIDYTGDMPVILGPDGPSLGGFVCPAVITRSELWKMGQLRPGDTIRFRKVSSHVSPVLQRLEGAGRVAVSYRHSGEDYLLVEYGAPVLDLELRFRVHALMEWLIRRNVAGIIDLTPGIRSLQIHYDSLTLAQSALRELLLLAEEELPPVDKLEVPSRIVHLPLSWDDPATQLAIDKYMQSVRPDAPWCPSNIEFIRRINGLDSIEDVKRIVFDASYLVMGLEMFIWARPSRRRSIHVTVS